MKKITLTTLAFFVYTFSFSQVTLEKTIESNIFINFLKLENGETKYYGFDIDNFELNIYNLNHSIFKTVSIDKNSLNIYDELGDSFIACVSQKIFDTDEGIEFVFYISSYDSSTNSSIEKTFIIDDNGTAIFSKDDQFPQIKPKDAQILQNPDWIRKTENGWFMILTEDNSDPFSNSNNKKYIYKLSGNSNLANSKISYPNLELKAYPNPSSNFINLEYNLPDGVDNGKVLIYNLNGKKVKEYNVDNHVNSLKLNNQDLNTGTYIYSVVAGNYKSKPLKLIIQ